MQKIDTETTISGKGDTDSRLNEITGDELAIYRNTIIGYPFGVIKFDYHDFNYFVESNTIHLTDGVCFAYGYFAYHKAIDLTILPPPVENYYVIYVRIDKSVIPNTCEIKTKNNYASPQIGENAFRQDVLSTVKTGVFEIPLWLFKATNKGIDPRFTDKRPLKDKILNVEYSDTSKIVKFNDNLKGKLDNGVAATTQPIEDKSKKAATTEFVQMAIQAEINK